MFEPIDLYDASRNRPIPVALYRAASPQRATVVFSVGFGGNRAGYSFLARSWAARGWRVFVVEHVGSNQAVLKAMVRPGMRRDELATLVGEKARDPSELLDRPLDLGFAVRELVERDAPLGLGGHSFGSYTVLAALGAQALGAGGTARVRWKSERLLGRAQESVLGAVLMSPQPPDAMISAEGYASVALPTLVLTGTKDAGMPFGSTVEGRIRAFEALPPGQRLLGVLEGADHMAFAGVGLGTAGVRGALEQITGAFWEAQLSEVRRSWSGTLPGSQVWENAVEWKA